MATVRNAYIDNLRVLLTTLVIVHHVAVTYGAPGGWYYKEEGASEGMMIGLTMLVSINQAFFMGMFFFLSALFIPISCTKKGTKRFIIDRLKRLGIPLIFYSLILSPVVVYLVVVYGYHKQIPFFDFYIHRESWIQVGVLWFTLALLLFSCFYCVFRKEDKQFIKIQMPSNGTIFIVALMLGFLSFLVRIIFPVGWTLQPFGFQPAHFSQYIFLLTIGIIAGNNRWLDSLTYERGKFWGVISLVMIFVGFPIIYVLKIVTHSSIEAFLGGVTIQSLAISVWEQLTEYQLS